MTDTPTQQLAAHGQSVWVDFLSRAALDDGTIARFVADDGVVGLTSNPSLFEAAMAEGDAYDEQLREVLRSEQDGKAVFWALAMDDVRRACDLLRPVWDRTDHLDGQVSLEVDPGLAHDRDGTIAEAARLHELVDRQNLYVKIPATEPGLEAIEETIAAGIPVNVTLVFSLARHRAVAEAYRNGIRRLVDAGGDPSAVPSVASFFVSRVDAEGDKRLKAMGAGDHLRGRLAIANAKLAYQTYLEVFAGEAWSDLQAHRARPQRCLWASTSVKDPSYRDTLYVEELVGADTVNTMPPETLAAVQDHGEIRSATLEEGVDDARRLLEELERAGLDYDDLTATLEREGVRKFADAFDDLLTGVKAKRDAFAAA